MEVERTRNFAILYIFLYKVYRQEIFLQPTSMVRIHNIPTAHRLQLYVCIVTNTKHKSLQIIHINLIVNLMNYEF